MNSIFKYLIMTLFGSENRSKFTATILLLCVPIGIIVAHLPPILTVIFWASMIAAWMLMIADIKNKIDRR